MKTIEVGCDFGTVEQPSGRKRNKAPTIKICRQKPAVFIKSRILGSEAAVCEKCFTSSDPKKYIFKEGFENNPKAEYEDED